MKDKIIAEDVSFYYGSNQAIRNISLKVKKNSVMALIGPSGCGKSTFLRCINRMNDIIPETKITGDIKIDDVSIYGSKYNVTALRRKVGMVFQKSNPFPKSIFENIAYGLKINGVKDKYEIEYIVEKSLKDTALWDEVKDRLHKSALGLSGGQQQRLCIARTIAIQPEVILMDEPASALDPISTQKIEELIQVLKKDYTIIIVTHNMQQAARVSDYTAFFYMGELIEVDKTEKIFTRPSKEMTENYITGKFG
ncbi:MAG TPA: phosphate ABC transporter ATP-binding protein PstB [Spirochaetota bacterium]|nr:phosphate ABC transporter ATP-binding protein [Spirochaetota bacterium]OQA98246.1 MAG: Phosphate import ATP-binding protein PstB 3 [Spirochaetes bacterium ADurb.Bin218]HOK02198.1 phosphate ABC transporter ATP-binding protein PstB [Spirochaetota bacterium]HOK92240.1 phosphate ABC transporter ATP-binding protein PstB [Spirochaetota bacterium]HON14967.1 phosphate ABC transporter ATP-binding protein PstB [Spirochaetota bacterium]